MPNELLGALTGLLGVGLQGWLSEHKADRAHLREVELRRLDIEIAEGEARAAQLYPGSAEGTGPPGSLPFMNRRASAWVNDLRGMVRPLMSLASLSVVTAGFFAILWMGVPAAAETAFGQFVDLLDFVTVSIIVFWFGGRPPRR